LAYETYPIIKTGELEINADWPADVVTFEQGGSQRNLPWASARHRFKLTYGYLSEAQFAALRAFYLQHSGRFRPFWFQDYTAPNITGRTFDRGTGYRTRYKLPIDGMDSATIYVGGVATAAVVDTETGQVDFAVAPAAEAVLSFDAVNARYLVSFASDVPEFQRFKYQAWGLQVELIQEKWLGSRSIVGVFPWLPTPEEPNMQWFAIDIPYNQVTVVPAGACTEWLGILWNCGVDVALFTHPAPRPDAPLSYVMNANGAELDRIIAEGAFGSPTAGRAVRGLSRFRAIKTGLNVPITLVGSLPATVPFFPVAPAYLFRIEGARYSVFGV